MNQNDKDILVIILEKEAITKLTESLSQKEPQKTLSDNTNEQLSPREKKVLQLITQGKNNNEIANALNLSVHTIKADVCSILQKLNVSDRLKAAVKAVKEKLI